MKNRKNLPSGPNYRAFMEHVLSKKSLREHYLNFLFNQEAWLYADFFTKLGITMIDLQTDLSNLEDTIATAAISRVVYGHWLAAHGEGVCPNHIRDFGDYLLAHWDGAISEELSEIEDWSELYHNADLDNLDFECEALDFNYLFSLLNSDNSANLHSTLINQFQGAGVSTLQQKKNWLIDWYFSNDPMGSIYLATLRNSALVSTYQTNPGMLF